MVNYPIIITTFGFKYGRPKCNHFFDVSWIPNPWRHPEEDPVKLVLATPGVEELINLIADYAALLRHKDHAYIGIGCSAGRDRSPIIADLVAERIQLNYGFRVGLEHRDKVNGERS